MGHKYYFTILWGEVHEGSGGAVSSFQCGDADELSQLGSDPLGDWDSYDGGATNDDGVEVWDRSNDALTLIHGRGNDLDAVSRVFFRTIRSNFRGHLGI